MLNASAQVVEFFAKTSLIPRYVQENQLWQELKVPKNDWMSAAKQILAQVFSQEVLLPIEDADEGFAVEMPENEGVFVEEKKKKRKIT